MKIANFKTSLYQIQNTRSKLDWNWEMTTSIFAAGIIFKPFKLFLLHNLTRKF